MTTPTDDVATTTPVATAIPRLCTTDLDRTTAFYAAIGFEVRGRYDDYLILVRDTIELHFARWEFDPDTQAASTFVRVPDAQVLYDLALAAHPDIVRCGAGAITDDERALVQEQRSRTGSSARVHAIRDVPWGGREFALLDPDSNLLTIGEAGSGG